jgi:DNA-binding response OmpR family regulator
MATIAKKRVLLVEDDPLIAMVMEDVLLRMGLQVLVNHSLANALNELELADFDAALVDLGLRGESAHPLVQHLIARGTPFAVVTGADPAALKTEFPGVLVATKPLALKALEQMVNELLGRSTASAC